MLANGERADVLVWTGMPGATATIVAMPYERADGAGATSLVDLLHFVADDREPVAAVSLPDALASAAEAPAPEFRPMGRREWKDSIDVPADTTLVVEPHFDVRDGAAGSWMYHCHILGHAEGGMMGELMAR